MKKLIASIVMILVIASTSVFAAFPASVNPGYSGNSTGVIVITNPPKDKSATFDSSYIISGYGKEGAVVKLYTLSNGKYVPTNYTWTIGASGLFFKKINLNAGKNNILVVAQTSTSLEQTAYLEITYLGANVSQSIKNITVNVNNVF